MHLDEIKRELMNDERNQSYTKRGIPPVYQINEKAQLLIIGQAPGSHVEKSLIPFHDQSGRRLMNWLGISEDQFYSEKVAIMPMDFYYPGKGKTGDLAPRKFIAREYHQAIRALMPAIQLTILVGKYATDYYLKNRTYANLTETVRHYEEYLPDYFPIVHPSPLNARWLKKNPWFEEDVLPVLRKQVEMALANKK